MSPPRAIIMVPFNKSIREALGRSRVLFPNPGTGVLPTVQILVVSKSNTPALTVKIRDLEWVSNKQGIQNMYY